jgi:hypothetical protein
MSRLRIELLPFAIAFGFVGANRKGGGDELQRLYTLIMLRRGIFPAKFQRVRTK